MTELSTPSDEVLLRARHLDSNALGLLHDRYYQGLFHYVCFRLGDASLGDEIVREVFYQLLLSLKERKGPRRDGTLWLYQAAADLVDTRLRGVQASLRQAHAETVKDPSGARMQPENGENHSPVRQAMWQLPPAEQHLLAVRFAGDLSLEEIARALGKSSTQVRIAQLRALRSMRLLIAGQQMRKARGGKADRKVRALEVCLRAIQAGDSTEATLALYPKFSAELRPLLETGALVIGLGKRIQASSAAQSEGKADFLMTAQNLIPRPASLWGAINWRFFLWGTISLLVLLAVVWGSLLLAKRSLPGDVFYWLKIPVEQGSLYLARDANQRLDMERAADLNRLEEVQILQQRLRSEEVSLVGNLEQALPGEWQVSGFRVLIPPTARMVGEIVPGYYVVVQGELQSDGSLVAKVVQSREYEIRGEVQSITTDLWIVSGIVLRISPNTIVQGAPQVGSQVEIKTLLSQDGQWHVRLIILLD